MALLLSVTAHLGLLVTVGHRGGEGVWRNQPSTPKRPPPAQVRFLAAQPPEATPVAAVLAVANHSATLTRPATPPALAVEATGATETNESPAESPAIAEQKISVDTAALAMLETGNARYFRSDELTEKPFVVSDSSTGLQLELPDIYPQPAIVHLLIDEQGEIDKVLLEESFLSDQAKRFVIDSFAKTKFSPGKLGDMRVKSQLTIEVRLDAALKLPLQ